jgi:hypothetical protein
MSDESSPKAELPVVSEELQAQIREYQAKRDQEYDDTMRWLESAGIEPEQRAAYDATLTEMLALPVNELAWPSDDPRYRLHRAMEYGDKLMSRRTDIEARFEGRLPPDETYAIKRYALAALHAFKEWRSNPEPEESFGKVLKDAAKLRNQLRSQAACFIVFDKMAASELEHYDGGITPEGIACDLVLLSGVLQALPPPLKEKMMATPLHLMEAAVVARGLLRYATQHTPLEFWEPTVLYARALTLVDRASFQAELVLSEFHNEERDPWEAGEWKPSCLFCTCDSDRQRHYRHNESLHAAQRRARFVSGTMTAALRRQVVEN